MSAATFVTRHRLLDRTFGASIEDELRVGCAETLKGLQHELLTVVEECFDWHVDSEKQVLFRIQNILQGSKVRSLIYEANYSFGLVVQPRLSTSSGWHFYSCSDAPQTSPTTENSNSICVLFHDADG